MTALQLQTTERYSKRSRYSHLVWLESCKIELTQREQEELARLRAEVEGRQ